MSKKTDSLNLSIGATVYCSRYIATVTGWGPDGLVEIQFTGSGIKKTVKPEQLRSYL